MNIVSAGVGDHATSVHPEAAGNIVLFDNNRPDMSRAAHKIDGIALVRGDPVPRRIQACKRVVISDRNIMRAVIDLNVGTAVSAVISWIQQEVACYSGATGLSYQDVVFTPGDHVSLNQQVGCIGREDPIAGVTAGTRGVFRVDVRIEYPNASSSGNHDAVAGTRSNFHVVKGNDAGIRNHDARSGRRRDMQILQRNA
jgi:hypothetical protein